MGRPTLLLLLVTLGLLSPALLGGWQFDDYLHHDIILANPHPTAVAMNLFRFWEPDPVATADLIERGILPWWSHPDGYLLFWRPLTALTHWLDYALWPEQAVLMHTHSLAYYALLVLAILALYRRLLPVPRAAFLAAVLYALDEAHGFPVAWLANRNAVLAMLMGVLLLWFYDRWRRDGWMLAGWVAPLVLGLGLLTAEATTAVWGYLLAYALCLDPQRGQWRAWLALLPLGVVTAVWLWLYRALGFGTYATAYADPFTNPALYLHAAAERAPLLLQGLWTPFPAEFYNLLFRPWSVLYWLTAVFFSLLMLAFCAYLWCNNPAQRPLISFLTLGMLLSLAPAVIIFPINRLLFFPGLGAFGLMAFFLGQQISLWRHASQLSSWQKAFEPRRARRTQRKRLFPEKNLWHLRHLWIIYSQRLDAVHIAALLVVTHLVVAPVLLPLNAAAPAVLGWHFERFVATLPPVSPEDTLTIEHAPSAFYAGLLPSAMSTPPARIRLLAATPYPEVTFTAVDAASTVDVAPQGGYLLGLDSLFRGRGYNLQVGDTIQLSDMSITVLALTPDGRPEIVRMRDKR